MSRVRFRISHDQRILFKVYDKQSRPTTGGTGSKWNHVHDARHNMRMPIRIRIRTQIRL